MQTYQLPRGYTFLKYAVLLPNIETDEFWVQSFQTEASKVHVLLRSCRVVRLRLGSQLLLVAAFLTQM